MPRWSNWARDQVCQPAVIERPQSREELCEVVARAATAGRKVRASASGHSFTDIALTDDVMVRLDHLTRPLSFDAATGLFKVEAGIVLGDLNRVLDEHGVAFANLGDIDRQTIAGAISTGTHGTGERFQNLGAQIAALELVTADGQLVTIDESEPELLRAARVGLGALGVIYSVTVRTVPAYTLHRVDNPKPLEETLARLDELNAANDHFEFYCFPHTRTALCRETKRTDAPPAPRHPAAVYLQEVVVENWVGQLFALAARRMPRRVPQLARMAADGVGRSTKIDRSYRVFASERRIKFTEMEYGVPREHAREAFERVLAIAERPELAVGYPIEVRFVAPDDAFLSPSYERDTCYIAVHQDRKLDWRSYFTAVEDALREFDARPHWGKRHFLTAAQLRELYPRWDDFQAVRKRLDPDGVFANAYVERVLGPLAPSEASK
jgi:FAD-linked oxidoreductase